MKIIGSNRNSLIGDIICSLVFANYIHKRYPKATKIGYIDVKCQQILPLLINLDCLDGIRVSELPDTISENDAKLFQSFDMVFEPFPTITEEGYYNKRSVVEETFRISTLKGVGRVDPKEWDTLTKEEKCPRLYQWFPVLKNNYIAIWASAGYNNGDLANQKRNPTLKYWRGLIDRLIKEGYKIAQLGVQSLSIDERVLNLSHYSLFDAVKFSLGSKVCLGVDSGSQWVCGAYGAPQIILSTYWRSGHHRFWNSLLPVNYKNMAVYLFDPTDINAIEYNKVIECIKNLN